MKYKLKVVGDETEAMMTLLQEGFVGQGQFKAKAAFDNFGSTARGTVEIETTNPSAIEALLAKYPTIFHKA